MDFRRFFEDKTSVWEFFQNCGKPVVLYGMGDGADKVLNAFAYYGIEVSGVFASDGFVRGQRWIWKESLATLPSRSASRAVCPT